MSSTRAGRKHAPGLARAIAAAGILTTLATLGGCAHPPPPPVMPWQREYLAKRGMRLDLPDELAEDRFRQHWYGAREGSDLGYGEPGGGCGCN
jgi:Domain of unknown function (DUF4266)